MLFSGDNVPERVLGVLMDIDERKRNAERQTLLVRELNHRVKNSLTVVQSLATQTFRQDGDSAEQLKTFQGRLQALAKANNVLLENDWEMFGMRPLVEEITGPYRDALDDPVSVEGEDLTLPPVANVPLALALHELCTNAAKYGALSRRGGRVAIRWGRAFADGSMELVWSESGGPEVVDPAQYGFGMRLLTRVLAQQLGSVDLRFTPKGTLLPHDHAAGASEPAQSRNGSRLHGVRHAARRAGSGSVGASWSWSSNVSSAGPSAGPK